MPVSGFKRNDNEHYTMIKAIQTISYNFSIFLFIVNLDCDYRQYGVVSEVTAAPGSFIVSPGYPNRYRNDLWCEIEVKLERNENIVLYFLSFSVQTNHRFSCETDYLHIMPGMEDELKICGNEDNKELSIPDPIVLTRDRVHLKFYSDERETYHGFKIQLSIGKSPPILKSNILS